MTKLKWILLSLLTITIVNSITDDIENKITLLINQMSLDEKISILHGQDMFSSPGIERLGVKGFDMSDGPHGVRYAQSSTCFPTNIALAATWDAEYMETVGAAYGSEFKAAGKNMALGPAVDIGRNPIAGRASETLGEEPYLGGKLFAAFTRGAQSNNLIACVKHFLAQNHDGDRDSTNPTMDQRTMREFYGLPFRLVVQEGEVYSVMSAYNLVNGKHCSENSDSLIDMLRTEWGYKYFVVSDWWGTYSDPANLINGGLDMEMPDNHHYNQLKDAVINGKVQQSTVDMAVRRTLRSRFMSGMMSENYNKGNISDLGSEEHRQINLEAARRSLVLLKNQDNILPLKKSGRYALIGPNAANLPITSFGSSEIVDPAPKTSTKDGIQNLGVNFQYVQGCDINSWNSWQFEEAKNAARNADAVIFVGGLDNTQEGEAYDERTGLDRTGGSVMLPGQQLNLIRELASVNPNLVVVVQSGGVVSLGDTVNSIKGIVYGFYCGNECGTAIAEVLFGDYNPGGKMPIAMPANDQQLPAWQNLDFTNDMIAGFGYRRFDKTGEKPIFNFGHGLSYTTFQYSKLRASSLSIDGKDGLTISVFVTNTGQVKGDEVAQLYLSQKVSVPMPVKQLRGFKRITLLPGETAKVTFELTPHELSYWSTSLKHYFVEKGTYFAQVGGSSDDLKLNVIFNVVKDYSIPYPATVEIPSDSVSNFAYVKEMIQNAYQ